MAKNKDYSFVFTNKPLNKTAAQVLSKGEHCCIDEKNYANHSKEPLNIIPFNRKKNNLTGKKFGQLTVIGYHRRKYKKNGTGTILDRWVVKCSCGGYEIRKGKILLLQKTKQSRMCVICEQIDNLRTNKNYKPSNDWKFE